MKIWNNHKKKGQSVGAVLFVYIILSAVKGMGA